MLWKYSHLTSTRAALGECKVANAICRDCGFVFVSLVPEGQALGAYYTDSIGSYVGPMDYDVGKRLGLLWRFVGPVKRFVELGNNLQSHFHAGVREMFVQVITVEPSNTCESDYTSIKGLPNGAGDVLANYFVLAHIPRVREMFAQFFRVLAEDGILICEVPDIRMYPNNILGCH